MIGDRLAAARKKSGLTQVELAVALGDRYNQQMISHVERGRSSLLVDGLVSVAKELKVSTDYLLGLTDDPTSAEDRLSAAAKGWQGDDEIVVVHVDSRPRGKYDGSIRMPEVTGLPFFRSQLDRERIDPGASAIYQVKGQSMYPALPHGTLVLVDYSRDYLRDDAIYLVILQGTLLVKRLYLKGPGDWYWCTDYWLGTQGPSHGFDKGRGEPGNWYTPQWRHYNRVRGLWREDRSEWGQVKHDSSITVLGQVHSIEHTLLESVDSDGFVSRSR